VDALPATAAAAAGLFAGTNIDDMIMLAVLSASSRATGRPRRWQIRGGQYAGVAALVVVSVAARPAAPGPRLRKPADAIRVRRSGRDVPPHMGPG
jgi:hypothetical protein